MKSNCRSREVWKENFWSCVLECFVVVNRKLDVPVAQLDRVSASDAEGRGFESLRVRHKQMPPLAGGICLCWVSADLSPRGSGVDYQREAGGRTPVRESV